MGHIETFDHTADVGLRVTAETLDDLFATAAEGLFDYIVVNRREIREDETETISLAAESSSDLLAKWLNELIFRSETRHRVYTRFAVHVSDRGLALEAEIFGEPIDVSRHILDHEVKAATQHGLFLDQKADGFLAEIILDI